MTRYIVERLAFAVLMLFGVSLILFAIVLDGLRRIGASALAAPDIVCRGHCRARAREVAAWPIGTGGARPVRRCAA